MCSVVIFERHLLSILFLSCVLRSLIVVLQSIDDNCFTPYSSIHIYSNALISYSNSMQLPFCFGVHRHPLLYVTSYNFLSNYSLRSHSRPDPFATGSAVEEELKVSIKYRTDKCVCLSVYVWAFPPPLSSSLL